MAGASGDIEAEHSYVFSWLRPDDPGASSGRYDVGADRALRFSLSSGALRSSGPVPVVVDCEASWESDALVVRSESRATGYRSSVSYRLVQINGMTTLGASA